MPIVYIDGEAYEFEGKPKLLQFMLDHGIEVPYFCYHPSLSIPTNCRMCLVEVGYPVRNRQTGEYEKNEDGSLKINWGFKPVTSCSTDVVPEMHVKTQRTSEVVRKAQRGVLEFMLINHPLDCPICDQAGECPLQINTFLYGPEGSRFEREKVHKPKRIELGPRVILDAERCINCTRCVRFTDEISKSHQLTIISRGNKNFPATFPGQIFDDPYSMNVIDICPVGALTSKDFRFKARVWEMSSGPSICTHCARGCNIDVWVRDNLVLRLTPRPNPQVNQYWMCDEGRLSYRTFNEKRLYGPRRTNGIPISYDHAFSFIANSISNAHSVLFIGSPFASLENNYALKTLAEWKNQSPVYFVSYHEPGWGDSLLRVDDRAPNEKSCQLLGFTHSSIEEILNLAKENDLILCLEDERIAQKLIENGFGEKAIVFTAHEYEGYQKALINLPSAMSVEMFSIYLNSDGIAQMSFPIKQIRWMTPEMWMWFPKSRLDSSGVSIDNWRHPEHIVDCLPSWLMIAKIEEHLKGPFTYQNYEAVFQKIQAEYPDLLGKLDLPKCPPKSAFKRTQLDFALR